MLEVRVLGGLSAAVDGRPVELPADARARELLARLALAPGPQPRSALAGRLRPDVAEDSARKTLRNALYELRRALGEEGAASLAVSDGSVGLADGVRVDVREFRARIAGGDLEGAAEAGRGELLAGLEGDWALRERDAHAAELAGVLSTLAARAESSGDLGAAVAWVRRRLEVEPLAEAAHREVIRLLALAGDRAAALAAASALADRLRSELGVAPSAETRALVEEVRRGRPSRSGTVEVAAPAPALPAVFAAAARPEGRDEALGALEAAWTAARDGALRFALVTGEPGIGKTTLAAELARRAHAAGAAVLLGRSDEHALLPFQPWVEALERLLDALGEGEADHWLSAHDGALARLLPARTTGDIGVAGPRERHLAFELVRELLEDVAARRPVLLVLDDVHWADADSLALVRHLARAGSPRRLLVVVCARPAELDPTATEAIADLRREGPLVQVDLAGLDADAIETLVARARGRSTDAAEAARRLRERTGGNPFFVGELLREAPDPGASPRGAPAAPRDPSAPPAGVREVIGRRLAKLGDATLRTLDVAALCGLEFDLDTVAGVEDRSPVEVLEALDEAVAAAVVLEGEAVGRYAFPHALVVEAIVAGLSPSRRARLHLRIADVLAERHAHRSAAAAAPASGAAHRSAPHPLGTVAAADVVRHLRAAGPLAGGARLGEWERAAAREAAAALAHAEAAAHLEAALAAHAPPPDERARLLVALGDAHDRAGARERAREAFAEAAALAQQAGDHALLARAALGHGGVSLVVTAADHETVRLLERALAAVPPAESALAARLLARLSIELYYSDPESARGLSAQAVDRARGAGDPAALAAALNARRVALWAPQHIDERLAVATEMVAAAEASGDREAVLQGRNWRVVDLLELGRIPEVAAEIDAYEALADEVGLPHFQWYVPLWRSTLAQLAGRWDEAERLTDEALALGHRADDPNAPLFASIQREHRLFAQRRIDQVDRQRLVDQADLMAAEAAWLVHLALVDAERGDTESARRLIRELTRDGCRHVPMDANWHGACVLADAAVLVGDRDAAAALYDLLVPHAGLFPVIARGVASLGSAEVTLGRLAAFLGRHEEAEVRLRRAVEENEHAGTPPYAAIAASHLAHALDAVVPGRRGRD